MTQSLGELVDRLMTTTLKLWHVQDAVHKAAKEHTGLNADTVQKLDGLNRERNRLMTEVDRCLDAAVKSGETTVDPRIKM